MNRKHIVRQLRNKGIEFDHNLSTKDLDAILSQPEAQNRVCKSFNFASGGGKIKVAFNVHLDDSPADITVVEDIGANAWTGKGFCLQDMTSALDSITPKTRPLNFLIDSPGGDVNTGKAIHNLLLGWKGVINKTIIGVAASTASWCIPADTTRAYKNSQIFMHRAMCLIGGNRDDAAQAVEFLDKTDAQISVMYADQSGNEPGEMLDMMKKETLLTGAEAKACGMVDEIIDGTATNKFSVDWLNSAKKKLAALNTLSARNQDLSAMADLCRECAGECDDCEEAEGISAECLNACRACATACRACAIACDAGDNSQCASCAETCDQCAKLCGNESAAECKICAIACEECAKSMNTISVPMQGADQTKPTEQIMNKTQMLALLNKWGVTVPDKATDEQIIELVNAGKPAAAPAVSAVLPVAATNLEDHPLIKELRATNAANRRKDIQGVVRQSATDGKITVLEIDNWVNDAAAAVDHPTNGNPVLARLAKLENRAPGISPLPEENTTLEVRASLAEIQNEAFRFDAPMKSWKAGNSVDMKEIVRAARNKSLFLTKMNNRIQQAWNANVIAPEFQRAAILNVVIVDFARRLIPLNLFSTVFQNIPLLGTNKVEVGFLDLDTVASISWDPAVGYTNPGGTVLDKREIQIGTASPHGDRKRVGLSFSSEEFARQPYLKIVEWTQLKVNKLASDIITDVLSVVTAANYGAPAKISTAGQFDSDDIADLKLACKLWPFDGRGLLLDSAYDANLLKDPSFKYALNAASDSAIKEGKLFPRVEGFNYYEFPTIPDNGENLVGMAIHQSAILFATAPVPPVAEVRNAGTIYEVVVEPVTGVAFEYRSFGNNVLDTANQWVELSYGYAKGNGHALKRIVSA